eukprot:4912491-Amphidinium_carterae.1
MPIWSDTGSRVVKVPPYLTGGGGKNKDKTAPKPETDQVKDEAIRCVRKAGVKVLSNTHLNLLLSGRPRVAKLLVSAQDHAHMHRILVKEGRSASLPLLEGASDKLDTLNQNQALRDENKAAREAKAAKTPPKTPAPEGEGSKPRVESPPPVPKSRDGPVENFSLVPEDWSATVRE